MRTAMLRGRGLAKSQIEPSCRACPPSSPHVQVWGIFEMEHFDAR
jgi:hypothetical protein